MNTDTTPNLKPQTVYIPITFDESFNGGRVVVATHEVSPHECMSLKGGDMYLKQKENQICLSKEELVKLLGKVFDGGFNESGEGWNAKYPTDYKNRKEQIINNIFNQ